LNEETSPRAKTAAAKQTTNGHWVCEGTFPRKKLVLTTPEAVMLTAIDYILLKE